MFSMSWIWGFWITLSRWTVWDVIGVCSVDRWLSQVAEQLRAGYSVFAYLYWSCILKLNNKELIIAHITHSLTPPCWNMHVGCSKVPAFLSICANAMFTNPGLETSAVFSFISRKKTGSSHSGWLQAMRPLL